MTMVINLSKLAKNAGPLNSLTPNFSLIDVLKPEMVNLLGKTLPLGISEADHIKSCVNNERLRIYLTDPSVFRKPGDFKAHAFVDEFEGMEHLLSACLLSSYVPIGTGPLRYSDGCAAGLANKFMSNRTVCRAVNREGDKEIREARDNWIDGGLAQNWPTLDSGTIVVSPIAIQSKSNIVISPKIEEGGRLVELSKGLKVGVSFENGLALKNMILSTEEATYQEIYNSAYDDATRVIKEKNLI